MSFNADSCNRCGAPPQRSTGDGTRATGQPGWTMRMTSASGEWDGCDRCFTPYERNRINAGKAPHGPKLNQQSTGQAARATSGGRR